MFVRYRTLGLLEHCGSSTLLSSVRLTVVFQPCAEPLASKVQATWSLELSGAWQVATFELSRLDLSLQQP